MGAIPLPRVENYWQDDKFQRPSFRPHMGVVRFEQIKRYLHISWPTTRDPRRPEDKCWWSKLEPLACAFQRAAGQYYTPGSNVSIDETMVRCFGRSKHTVKMPNKPIKQGYKLFALAEHGYIRTFTWSSRLFGIVDLFRWPGLSPTGSMVIATICKLPGFSSSQAGSPTANADASAAANTAVDTDVNEAANADANQALYSVYLDNYFSTIALFEALRDLRCGACGTTRRQGGTPPQLVELKDHIKSIPWGTLYTSEARGFPGV
ncbi:uncharacterized protein N7515_004893 [Penicillium bovifimosum]|uniref:PiggyBac transposable element-derived protein domain-containing protein n=1 Tax=Penicillium bovifimosum TaxID=126998 RepID=A0A9W9L2U9_9EURO|nr:uncharacterized protein N7515_004893 [Penicillium bovifimosum]KAJ5135615.1 hypothetical protein N7515_004893 [Penicillium bovifimosum]